MRLIKTGLFTLPLLAFVLALSTLAVSQTQGTPDLRDQYVGTWHFVSGSYGGREFTAAQLDVGIKHVTPTHFTWLSYDRGTGRLSRAGGGAYTLAGDVCKESVQYGMGNDYEVTKGREQTLQIKIEGDRLYSRGKLTEGTEITEVWERVK